MPRLGWCVLLLVPVVVDRAADAFPTQRIAATTTTTTSSSTCPQTVPYSSALWGGGGADNSPLSPEDRPTSYPWIPQSGSPSFPGPAAATPPPLNTPSNTNPVRPQQQQQQQQQASSNKYLYAPSSSSPQPQPQPQPPRDPWTGFPLSVYENPTLQSSSPRPRSSSPGDNDNDDWQRDFQHLQDQVSQLGSDLSFFSSQLGGRSSSLSSSSAESPFSSWEQSIRNQLDKVKDAQLMVGRQVQQSIQDIRESVSIQDSKLSYLYQQSKEQTQRMTNLSQIVTTTIDDQQSRMSHLPTSKDVDERLRALEARLTQQQQDLFQQGAAGRWDPILQAMETKLQEQAELLNQALLDPSNNARLSVVETKLDQMQDELFEVMMRSRQPNIRLEALEDRVLLRDQQQQQQTNKDNIDPRLTALEANMKLQEEQIREATAALSDARITAMRAKLIEQQEQLEQGMPTTPTTTTSSGSARQQQQQQTDETNKGWAPFGQWNARPEVTKQERDQDFRTVFPPFRAPSPSTDLPTSFESYQSTSPVRDDNDGAGVLPPPPFSYQNVPPPPQDDPVGSRRVRRPINTSPPRKPMSDFRAYQPPSPPPPPTTGSTSRGGGSGGGGFRGNPFGRAGGVTIATEDDQKPVDMGIPRKAIAESARPDRRNRFTPPPPNNNNRAPGPFSDQDLWRRDALDPDSAPTSRRAAKITSDQDRWDSSTAPNPDAIPRPPQPLVEPRWSSFNNGVGSQSSPPKRGFSGGVTSDQGRLSSSARVARDIDDLKATTAASPPASHIRPRQQPSIGTTAPTPSYYQSTKAEDEDDMFMKDHVLSEYMEWCAAYDREPSEYRFQNFYANYAEMGATRQFPVLDEFADYSNEELSNVGRR